MYIFNVPGRGPLFWARASRSRQHIQAGSLQRSVVFAYRRAAHLLGARSNARCCKVCTAADCQEPQRTDPKHTGRICGGRPALGTDQQDSVRSAHGPRARCRLCSDPPRTARTSFDRERQRTCHPDTRRTLRCPLRLQKSQRGIPRTHWALCRSSPRSMAGDKHASRKAVGMPRHHEQQQRSRCGCATVCHCCT